MRSPLSVVSIRCLTVGLAAAVFLVLSGTAAAEGHGSRPGAYEASVVAFCSIPPQSYIIERIGGEHVSVHVMVGPGQSPHTFEPTPKQMAALAEADVYFAIGLPFESSVLRGLGELSARLIVTDMSEGIARRQVEERHGHHDEHGGPDDGDRAEHGHTDQGHADHGPTDQGHAEHGHEEPGHHGGISDPHVWLNPRNAQVLARNTCDALKQLSPGYSELFDANLAALLRDLEELDAELAASLAPLEGESVYVFHPAFGYFTDAYGLRQVAVEVGGTEPSARELVGLTRRAAEEGVRVIFVQPQFSSRSAEAIASEIGGAVVAVDPLSADYIENLRHLAREVRSALGAEKPDITPDVKEGR